VIQIGVLAGARRETLTTQTCANLDSKGAARAFDCRKTVYYSAPLSWPIPSLPPGWVCERRSGPHGAGPDFEWMVSQLDPRCDAILFEDDVYPITNCIAAISRIEVPENCAFVSFYDFLNVTSGEPIRLDPQEVENWGLQAIRIPAWLIRNIMNRKYRREPNNQPQDAWMGRIAAQEKKLILQYPSFVQHVGSLSIHCPGATLTGQREPSKSFPEPFEITAISDPFCTFHGCVHKNSTMCPIRGE
jgi:hypothetical protein